MSLENQQNYYGIDPQPQPPPQPQVQTKKHSAGSVGAKLVTSVLFISIGFAAGNI